MTRAEVFRRELRPAPEACCILVAGPEAAWSDQGEYPVWIVMPADENLLDAGRQVAFASRRQALAFAAEAAEALGLELVNEAEYD